MKILTTIILFALIFYSKLMFGQTGAYSDSLICGEWHLLWYQYFDIEKELISDPVNRNYDMTFYSDHKVKTNYSLKRQNGVWIFDPNTKQLSITYNETNEIETMKVLELSESELTLDYTDENGKRRILWMVLSSMSLD